MLRAETVTWVSLANGGVCLACNLPLLVQENLKVPFEIPAVGGFRAPERSSADRQCVLGGGKRNIFNI